MKYFTRGHANGEFPDEETEKAVALYRERLEQISGDLPESMRRLADEISLHDAVIERIVWIPSRETLTINAVANAINGDASTVVSVAMEYGGAMLGTRRLESLEAVARDRETVILDSEIDIDDFDGALTHRMLFWPRDEVTIDFRTFRLVVAPRDGYAVELAGAFIVVESDDTEKKEKK